MTVWRVNIDTGGTFTDCLALGPRAEIRRVKILSSGALRAVLRRADEGAVEPGANRPRLDPLPGLAARQVDGMTIRSLATRATARIRAVDESWRLQLDGASLPSGLVELTTGESAPVLAARLAVGTTSDQLLPPMDLRLGTTRGTNALLEEAGARVALFITAGFTDLLEIDDQRRPDLFTLDIRRPRPLHGVAVGVDERLAADGTVVRPLTGAALAALESRARELVAGGYTAAAVSLLHAERNDSHERAVVEVLVRAGFAQVSIGSALSREIKILPRTSTAVVDAYLAPVIRSYLDGVASAAPGTLHVMTSAGGLERAESYDACDSLLSGPAGGVAGVAAVAERADVGAVLGFDMGGTSTDVARYAGVFDYRFETRVGPARLQRPALDIATVAAGGGSICQWRDGLLRVGPESAGADPGPACYGAGGPLTITDVNLLLGRLDPGHFRIPVDPDAARDALDGLRQRIAADTATAPEADALLEGLLAIADERMAALIEQVSIGRGEDPSAHALVAFGGAGGQHACAVASRLGIDRVVFPADASILSAVGLAHAVVERFAVRQVLEPLERVGGALQAWFDELDERARRDVIAEGIEAGDVEPGRRLLEVRLEGQDSTLAIEWPCNVPDAFVERYTAVYGHSPPARAVEVVLLRVTATSRRPDVSTAGQAPAVEGPVEGPGDRATVRRVRAGGSWHEARVLRRERVATAPEEAGPALIVDDMTTALIEPGWSVRAHPCGDLVCTRTGASRGGGRLPAVVGAALFTGRFTGVVEEAGRVLQRTSLSTNVKERLDFSCGLLDATGRLVVNAPHIPVHLGSLGLCVRRVLETIEIAPGDVIVTNDPGAGGSHLPDVTVITPIHEPADMRCLGFIASRAHHAEIGGVRPGSMPPNATRLDQEGVLIRPMRLIAAGEDRFGDLERLLRSDRFPTRAVDENLADLRAAVAANRRGVDRFLGIVATAGASEVRAHMDALRQRAEMAMRAAFAAIPDGCLSARQAMDDGSVVAVSITIEGDQAVIDFDGSGPVHPGNLNATPAIVHGAVIYVLRLLAGSGLPLNEGVMEAIDLRIPPGMLSPDFNLAPAPAVVGGNVETSQRLVAVLLEAFDLAADSQGTMNNVLFGSEAFGYYETVAGGAGAGPGFDGESAVHTHMTNTRITDPEILEHRYPVRLHRFERRRGSGGVGAYSGGDGVIREIEFLAPLALSILSQHRSHGPAGRHGGGDGRPGRQTLIPVHGPSRVLDAIDGCDVVCGDRLLLETPGGGGWGPSGTVQSV